MQGIEGRGKRGGRGTCTASQGFQLVALCIPCVLRPFDELTDLSAIRQKAFKAAKLWQ